MRTIRDLCAIVGSTVIVLSLFGAFGVGEFRMCYGKTGECALASEVKRGGTTQ